MRRIATAGGAVLLSLSLLAAAAAPSPQDREAELARLRERIRSLQAELESDRSRYDVQRQELKRLESRIGTLSRSISELDGQLERQRSKLGDLEREAAELETSVAAERERLGSQIRAAYAVGRQEFVKILLNQEDPASVGRVMAYYDYLNRARSERIGAFLESLDALEAVLKSIEAERRRLEGLREKRLKEKSELEATQTSRNGVLRELQAALRTKDEQLSALRQDEKELESLVKVLTEALGDIPSSVDHKPFGTQKGRMVWPARGALAVRFGAKHTLGDFRWQGVLIQAKEGERVRAISHGRVAFADWLRGYGLLMIVDHGDGYMSLYGHNQSLFKETGDWVEAGEVIAQVGRSGGREASALYFEIRQNGQPLDPAQWCKVAAK